VNISDVGSLVEKLSVTYTTLPECNGGKPDCFFLPSFFFAMRHQRKSEQSMR
jgi:hypothetical protein